MNVSDILASEFGRYYTADELPARSAPDSDTILRRWAEDSVHRLARRAKDHLGELIVLIDEMKRNRKHVLFSEINDATSMEWNVEDADWRIMDELLTYIRTGLAEIGAVSEARGREALLRGFHAYRCDQGDQRWYVIERVSNQQKVVHVRSVESVGRRLTIQYELVSTDLTHTLARLLIDRVLLADFLDNKYANSADVVEYVCTNGIVCVLPMAYGQRV